MSTTTWNLKLTATDEHPETTIEGIPQADAAKILRGLMSGPDSYEYRDVRKAVAAADDAHERPLAA